MTNYHYLFKFLVAGDQKVGKSTLIKQFTEQTHRNTYIPSHTIQFASKKIVVNDLQIKCQLWDIGSFSEGQGSQALAHSLCKKAASILLLFDLSNRTSFLNLQKWLEDIQAKCSQSSYIVLVGNKLDKEELEITKGQAQQFSRSVGLSYYEISSFEQKATDLLFQEISKSILDSLQSRDSNIIMNKIKKGNKLFSSPSSPQISPSPSKVQEVEGQNQLQSQFQQKCKQADFKFETKKTEDSQQMINIMDQLNQSLNRTIILEQLINRIKIGFQEKGFAHISQVKQKFILNKFVKQSKTIQDLFEIFSTAQKLFAEQEMSCHRISVQNQQLNQYKEIQYTIKLDKQMIEQLKKKIEVLNTEKRKLESFKQNCEKREKNLLQILDKIKKQKKQQIEKNEIMSVEFNKLQSKIITLSRQLSRYQQRQEELRVSKLIEEKYDSEIIEELDSLHENQINSNLLTKLKRKFSQGVIESAKQ